jgi:hypothetical protein
LLPPDYITALNDVIAALSVAVDAVAPLPADDLSRVESPATSEK